MDQLTINIRLRYVTLLVGVITTLAVAVFVWDKSQPVQVLFSILTVGTATTALVYTAINSQFTGQVHIEQLRTHKLENAMTFMDTCRQPK